MLLILVKLPSTAIDEKLMPYFQDPLKAEKKFWGDKWVDLLPEVDDPAEKFTQVTKITIVPEQAKGFLH